MMRLPSTISILTLTLVASLSGAAFRTHPLEILGQDRAPTDCQTSLGEMTRDPEWLAHLFDPVLTSRPEINATLELYSRVHACLSGESATTFPEAQDIDQLVEYFLIFAGGLGTTSDASSLDLVSLGASTDAAVRELRDSVGISPPPGFIYVRSYTSVEAMPDPVRSFFDQPSVQGLTMFSRYIAVVSPDLNGPSPSVSRTISHELVHAFVNSAVGPRTPKPPTWYAEGLAAHFSQSSEPSCFVYVSSSHEIMRDCSLATEDYEQYAENFRFLQDVLGKAKFQALVKQSVADRDPSVLYRQLGIATYDNLVQRTDAWHEEKNKSDAWRFLVGGVGAVCLLALMIVGANWLRPRLQDWRLARELAELKSHTQLAAERSRPSVRKQLILLARQPGPTVKPVPLAQAQPTTLPVRPPRTLSPQELARAEAFWAALPHSVELLGSDWRVQVVLQRRGAIRGSEWSLDHSCPNCQRRAVLLLPNDVSYEQYADGLGRWAKANFPQLVAPAGILRPYAVCLYCGTLFGGDRLGIPRPPLPIRAR